MKLSIILDPLKPVPSCPITKSWAMESFNSKFNQFTFPHLCVTWLTQATSCATWTVKNSNRTPSCSIGQCMLPAGSRMFFSKHKSDHMSFLLTILQWFPTALKAWSLVLAMVILSTLSQYLISSCSFQTHCLRTSAHTVPTLQYSLPLPDQQHVHFRSWNATVLSADKTFIISLPHSFSM